MSYTPYDDSIPVAQDALKCMMHILKIGEQQPNASDLPSARLHPDMLPLTFQVDITTNTAMKLLARLSGSGAVRFEDELVTFSDMYTRIEKAQELLGNADRNLINSRIDETITLGVGHDGEKAPFHASALIWGYSLPTIYFHVATAYGILRKEGVPLSKSDYIASFGERLTPV